MVLLLVWSELIIIQKQMHIYWSTFVVYVYVLFFFEKITMVTRSAKITKKSNKIRTDLFANYALFVTT